ncbi:MAG: pyridoxal-phosphate-dependent aminotransferase family protein [Dehalococcoidia bacterium]
MQLRIPGPTPIPPNILQVMSKQMIDHRGKEFAGIIQQVTERLKELFQTKNDVLILTCSGTGGMEAAVVNTLSPGDGVLAVSIGAFGDRFAEIAEMYGAQVTRLDFPWGQPADPDGVRQALKKDPGVKAVLLTHNETSTGVTSDLAALTGVVREFDKLILVDAISSLGCIDLRSDAWGCDVVVTGSQKGWMAPPGLAMVSVSPRAWQAHADAKIPRYYMDFSRAKSFLEKSQTPWTPAVTAFYALAASLELMAREELGAIVARHARVGAAAREGVKSLGLSLFPDEAYASNTVTAVKAPDGLEVAKLLAYLRDELGIALSGGQAKLSGKIFRIGHLGWVTEGDIEVVIKGLQVGLAQVGYAGKA